MKKRMASLALVCVMALSFLPASVFAAQTAEGGANEEIVDVNAPGGQEKKTLPDDENQQRTVGDQNQQEAVSEPGGSAGEGEEENQPDPTVVAKIGDKEYTTLSAAFNEVQDGETVTVAADCELAESITVDQTVTLDLNEKTVTVSIGDPAAGVTTSAFVVTEAGNFTVKNGRILGKVYLLVDGMGEVRKADQVADNRALEGRSGSAITLNGVTIADFAAKSSNGGAVCVYDGNLEIYDSSIGYYDYDKFETHGNFARNGGGIYGQKATITVSGTELFYNVSLNPDASKDTSDSGGGAIYVFGGALTVSDDCYFFGNRTWDSGGAIHLDQAESAKIEGNRFRSSEVYGHSTGGYSVGGDGGAIYSRISKTITITNNQIRNGYARNNGGGLCVIGDARCKLTMSGNTITKNEAGRRGGGLKVSILKGGEFNLISGTISGNSAQWGGGLDYTTHDTTTLKLNNVLITGNHAIRGAGIWACPTSETASYSTLGGAIYGNTAELPPSPIINLPASGDEIRYENGKNWDSTPDKLTIQGFYVKEKVDGVWQYVETETGKKFSESLKGSTMTVSKRALGGGLMQWYQDEAEKRYVPGNAEADPKIYTNTNESFGLHGELADEYQALAKKEALLIIENNTAGGRGGGIATNSSIEIGMKDQDVSVEVTKVWPDGVEHPKEVVVDLYRVNADGNKLKLDSNVVLNKDNNWTYTFTELPSKYVDENQQVQECSYEVAEHELDGWHGSCQVEEVRNSENRITAYQITLTNTPEGTDVGSLTVEKFVNTETTQAFAFTVTLSDQTISGQYGDMTFVRGEAKFSLKDGEHVTAAGLPAGITYRVEEAADSQYTSTSTGASGTIEKDGTAVASFRNIYKEEPIDPDPDPDPETVNIRVKKVWKLDDGGKAADSVTVVLYRNGTEYRRAVLSDNNDWSYVWRGLDADDVWTVDETDVPDGFTAEVTRSGNTFTVTNDDKAGSPSKDPDDPPKPPKDPEDPQTPEDPGTPDQPETPVEPSVPDQPTLPQTGQPWALVLAMLLAGLGLTALGLREKLRHHPEGMRTAHDQK